MTTDSLAIQFLKSTDIWPLFVEFNSGQYQSVSSCELRTVAQSSLGLYSALASEYDQFLQEKYLDNILLEINGIDYQLFTSNKNPLLVVEAHNRLQSLLFGNRFVTADCETGIHALWFPPIPINSMELDSNKKEAIKQNIIRFFDKELGLMVNEVRFSYLSDGAGWEEFFYERYFLPKKFIEITGMSIPILPNQKTEKSIMEYIQDGKTEWLESQVREQLTRSLGFDIQVPQPFIPSDSAALFMPFAKVALAIPPTVSASETIYLFNQTFQVMEWAEQDGYLTLLCMSPEGPYARTVTDVVTNIRELLCPPFMHFFNKHDLEWQSLTFILTDTEV